MAVQFNLNTNERAKELLVNKVNMMLENQHLLKRTATLLKRDSNTGIFL